MLSLLVLSLLSAPQEAPGSEPEPSGPRTPLRAPGAPAPEPAPAVAPVAQPVVAPSSDVPSMRMRLVEPEPSPRRLELRRVGEERVVCALPCEQDVAFPDHEFLVDGPGVTPSSKFRLTELAHHGRANLSAKAGDYGLFVLGVIGTVVGSLAASVGAPLALVGAARRTDVLTGAGIAALLTGGLLLVLGVPAILNNSTIITRAQE